MKEVIAMARNVTKKHGSRAQRAWNGPLLLSYGFRPFFLFGPLFAALAIGNWLLLLNGQGLEPAGLSGIDWHMHEMVFGYSSAAIAGFLLTAVPNWTGRMPVTGWPLFWLAMVWVGGRVALLSPVSLPWGLGVAIEAAFLPFLAAIIAREIVAGRNWRNLKVLLPIVVLAVANIWFLLAANSDAGAMGAVRLGLGAIIFLIMLIGGRIIPSFTRNWLARRPTGAMPQPFNRFDAATLAVSVIALLGWVAFGQGAVEMPGRGAPLLGAILALAGVRHVLRLGRWRGLRCVSNPILLVLHLFYAFLPGGLLVLAVAVLEDDPALSAAALHLFGIGGVGGMTMAVMARATLGHTGRTLRADLAMVAMFALVMLAALLRGAGAVVASHPSLITLAGVFWIAAFGLFVFRIGPWLLQPRLSKTG